MPNDRFMADGRKRLTESEGYRAARAEVIAAVRARYAEALASAGFLRRLVIRLRMQREIARELAKRPPIALRNTRYLLVQNLKRAVLNELNHGLQAEMWAQRQFFPFGAGMRALDRPWDQKPWSE